MNQEQIKNTLLNKRGLKGSEILIHIETGSKDTAENWANEAVNWEIFNECEEDMEIGSACWFDKIEDQFDLLKEIDTQ